MVVNLDFKTNSIEEIIHQLEQLSKKKWLNDYLEFIKEYAFTSEFMVQTSGTTGKRKNISVTKNQMQYSAKATLKFFKLQPGASVFVNLSCEFIAGKMMLVRAIEGKLNCFIAEPTSDPSNLIEQNFSFAPFVPLQIKNLIKSGKIQNFEQLLIGGGKLNYDLIELLKQFKTCAFESFGMTETLTHFALKKVSPTEEKWFSVLEGFEISSDKSDNLVIEYNPLTKNKIITNDLVELKGPNKFIWKGRSDNLINSGGVKLIPEEIEAKISNHILTPFVLIGLKDEILGEKIVLVLESDREINLELINNNLNRFEKIREQKTLLEFPKTISGKIKRKEIIKLFSA